MKQTKQYVKIQSNITVNVCPGTQYQDATNKDARVSEQLRIIPLWQNCVVTIHAGQHTYPAEIAEWPTVKNLERDGLLTIGTFLDEAEDNVIAVKKKLETGEKEMKTKQTIKDISLTDIAGDSK